MNSNKPHLSNLDIFRAVAALSVCLFHFNNQDDIEFSQAFTFGHYGVEIFFVISGFIIPLAMKWAGFRYRDSFRFLARRWVRLYPVFAIVVLLEVLLLVLVRPLLGVAIEGGDGFTWRRLIANLTLSCEFVGERWFLPVFWTLAQEAQYYLLIVFSFPLIVHRRGFIQIGILLLWIVPPYFVGDGVTIFTWSALFSVGILAFLQKEKLIDTRVFWALLLLAILSQQAVRNSTSAGLGLATCLVILYLPEIRTRWLVKLGAISYSLYLLHLIVGGAVQFNLKRLPAGMQHEAVSIAAAIAVSIWVSTVFYKHVERPFHQLARRFKTSARD